MNLFLRSFFLLPLPFLLIPIIFIKIGTSKNEAILNEKANKIGNGFVKWSEMNAIKRKQLNRIERFRFKQKKLNDIGLWKTWAPPMAIVPPETLKIIGENENIEKEKWFGSMTIKPNRRMEINGTKEGLNGIGRKMNNFEWTTQNPMQMRGISPKVYFPIEVGKKLLESSTTKPSNGFSALPKPILSKLPIKKLEKMVANFEKRNSTIVQPPIFDDPLQMTLSNFSLEFLASPILGLGSGQIVSFCNYMCGRVAMILTNLWPHVQNGITSNEDKNALNIQKLFI